MAVVGGAMRALFLLLLFVVLIDFDKSSCTGSSCVCRGSSGERGRERGGKRGGFSTPLRTVKGPGEPSRISRISRILKSWRVAREFSNYFNNLHLRLVSIFLIYGNAGPSANYWTRALFTEPLYLLFSFFLSFVTFYQLSFSFNHCIFYFTSKSFIFLLSVSTKYLRRINDHQQLILIALLRSI